MKKNLITAVFIISCILLYARATVNPRNAKTPLATRTINKTSNGIRNYRSKTFAGGGIADTIVIHLPTLAAMSAYTGTTTTIAVDEPFRGGLFHLITDTATVSGVLDTLDTDDGITFSSAISTVQHWKRDISNARSVNANWYGIGLGDRGTINTAITTDTTGEINMFSTIMRAGAKRSLYFPKGYYYWRPTPFLLPDSTEMYGDGPNATTVTTYNFKSGVLWFNEGNMILTGTYGSDSSDNIFRSGIIHCRVNPSTQGAQCVVLKTISDTSNFIINEVVALGALKCYHGVDSTKPRYHQEELNSITKIVDDTIFLKYPTSCAFDLSPSDTSNQPEIVKINNTGIQTDHSLFYYGTSRGIHVHDMNFAVPDIDLRSGIGIADNASAPPIGTNGCFECTFDNLAIEAYGGLGSDMITRSQFTNINLLSTMKLFDFGAGSSNVHLSNVHYTYHETALKGPSPKRTTAFIINDGTHNIYLDNISMSGNLPDNELMNLAGNNVYVNNFNTNLPKYNPRSSDFGIDVGDYTDFPISNIHVANSNFIIADVDTFMSVKGRYTGTKNQANINLSNISLADTNSATVWLAVDGMDGVNVNNVNIPGGNVAINNTTYSNFSNINAPNSALTTSGVSTSVLNNDLFNSTVSTVPSKGMNYIGGKLCIDGKYYSSDGDVAFTGGDYIINKVSEQNYMGTITWLDGTAPSGTDTANYSWEQVGSTVTLRINVKYPTAGTSNQNASFTLPSDCPAPIAPTGFTSGNDSLYPCTGGMSVSNHGGFVSNNSKVALFANSAGTGYEIRAISGAAVSAISAEVVLTYFTN